MDLTGTRKGAGVAELDSYSGDTPTERQTNTNTHTGVYIFDPQIKTIVVISLKDDIILTWENRAIGYNLEERISGSSNSMFTDKKINNGGYGKIYLSIYFPHCQHH